MINYTEKGIGLHDRIAALGLPALEFRDGEWWHPDPASVQPVIDAYTLDQCKADKCAAVLVHAKLLRDKAVASISAGEMASWPIKRAEATQFGLDPAAPCPMLSAEATKRGITLAELVAKVNSNSAMFSYLETTIGGNDGKHRDAIKALTTFEDVAGYDWSAGWPVL